MKASARKVQRKQYCKTRHGDSNPFSTDLKSTEGKKMRLRQKEYHAEEEESLPLTDLFDASRTTEECFSCERIIGREDSRDRELIIMKKKIPRQNRIKRTRNLIFSICQLLLVLPSPSLSCLLT
jgi:hypothetical protein